MRQTGVRLADPAELAKRVLGSRMNSGIKTYQLRVGQLFMHGFFITRMIGTVIRRPYFRHSGLLALSDGC